MEKRNIVICFYKKDGENIPVWVSNDPHQDILVTPTKAIELNKRYPEANGRFYTFYQGKEFRVVNPSLS